MSCLKCHRTSNGNLEVKVQVPCKFKSLSFQIEDLIQTSISAKVLLIWQAVRTDYAESMLLLKQLKGYNWRLSPHNRNLASSRANVPDTLLHLVQQICATPSLAMLHKPTLTLKQLVCAVIAAQQPRKGLPLGEQKLVFCPPVTSTLQPNATTFDHKVEIFSESTGRLIWV